MSTMAEATMFSPGSMQSPQLVIRDAFTNAIAKAFPSVEHTAVVTQSNPQFGDYQCNSAMPLFKQHKTLIGLATPRAIGEKIKANLNLELFSEVVVSPQGFITVKLHLQWLAGQLRPFVKTDIHCKAVKSLKCLIDYSSPNIAKEMHVGHLRSTIIGESICRILEHLGHSVLRVNHIGDWGTQFGMLIEYMQQEYPDFQNNPPPMSDLSQFYRASKKRFDESPDFKKRSQMNVVALQKGEKFARDAWKIICELSRTDFQKIYDRLDVHIEEFGESYYNDMIQPIVEDLEARGLIVKSEGAKCFFVEPEATQKDTDIPLMVVKSDGGFGYDSTDLAAIHYRLCVLKQDWVMYVTDLGQENHFHSIFKAAVLAGWHTPPLTRCDHIGFGVVQGEDGKKFKTRSGDLVKLTSLLDEAVERALKEIHLRRETAQLKSTENVSEASDAAATCNAPAEDQATLATVAAGVEQEEDGCLLGVPPDVAAAKIGYSAVKYFDLKQSRTTNYKFSYEKMLDPRGNTAVYLLYAYARICAIFRKAGVKSNELDAAELKIVEKEEKALALTLLRFPEAILAILGDMGLHRMAELMFDISTQFTVFYQTCRVIGAPQQQSRLILCELTRKMLQTCFHLMGIKALDRI